ncbi:hypothetical protein D8682_04905 [Buttiauxella sp. 3AFRM03]|uniref:hypothetical protein n=1 Tax=Buttiauxella sp. 3AFRM03 TaxID=2479367 RepID=UPI000EF85224|nr:hypothetical protein [Buttiauxella sp. 3AFRM03]AYN26394.1 hypothetical protein D8682_04905 [Buttiauxella sp. 3AFRM03]
MPQYTNEITPEIIHTLNNPYSESDLATFRETESKFITDELSKRTAATVVAIYRHATEGALTRNGGSLHNTSARSCILDDDGTERRFGLVGDEVIYPNGEMAKIVSGTGELLKSNGRSLALVGSLLDDGDIIVSTPQGVRMLVEYDDMHFGGDFLKPEA